MVNINNKILGNYQHYIDMGYQISDVKWQRGYISRKHQKGEDIPVYIVNSGLRKGEIFVLKPCFNSTNYCYPFYLTK